jgi:hypothetical protein
MNILLPFSGYPEDSNMRYKWLLTNVREGEKSRHVSLLSLYISAMAEGSTFNVV